MTSSSARPRVRSYVDVQSPEAQAASKNPRLNLSPPSGEAESPDQEAIQSTGDETDTGLASSDQEDVENTTEKSGCQPKDSTSPESQTSQRHSENESLHEGHQEKVWSSPEIQRQRSPVLVDSSPASFHSALSVAPPLPPSDNSPKGYPGDDESPEPNIPDLANDMTVKLDMQDEAWIVIQRKAWKTLDYEFFCTGLLREAMYPIYTGKARIVNGTTDREFQQGNRKLAMMGDTIMRTVLIDVWLRREESVAELETRIQGVVCSSNLERAAIESEIEDLLKSYFIGGLPNDKGILATTLKALIGAVWYDSKKNRAVIRKLLDRLLGTTLEAENGK